MMTKIRFCFRLTPEAGMAEDKEGNPAEAFSLIRVEVSEVPDAETYKEMHEALRKVIASQIEAGVESVIPISLDEYLNDTDDDQCEVYRLTKEDLEGLENVELTEEG